MIHKEQKLYLFSRVNNLKYIILIILLPFSAIVAQASKIPLVWNIPASNEYFIGRQAELKELETLVKKDHKVLVVGAGGIGKTQLVKEFAHKNLSEYQIIWWFDVAKNIDDQLILFADQLSDANIGHKINTDKVSSKAILIHIKEVLRKTDKKWLIIFDNARNLDIINNLFPETHHLPGKDIIITSRNLNSDLNLLQLKPFNEEDALAFMEKTTHLANSADLNYMIALLNRYPIALAQAATYIKTNNIKASEYVSLFKQDPQKLAKDEKLLLESENNHFDLNKVTIETTLSLNLQNLKEESKLGFEIIEIISLIKRPQVPGDLLFDFLSVNNPISKEDFKHIRNVIKTFNIKTLREYHDYILK